MSKRFLIVGALPSSLTNFRGHLIRDVISCGYEVTAMAAPASAAEIEKIYSLGAGFDDFPIERNGLNPFKDFFTFCVLKRKIEKVNPDIVLAYTIKPVIWSGIALRKNKRAKFYGLITGLGFAFQGDSWYRKFITFLVLLLYRISLQRANAVIFQNQDDKDYFIKRNIVAIEKCHVVDGSGVDTSHFYYASDIYKPPMRFITIARLIEEKGLRFYKDAALLVRKSYPEVIFQILGAPDPSPDAIRVEEILAWQRSGAITYLGETGDVRPYVEKSHVFVLASYYGEGLPRTILEAMSMGKPVITTDNVGCRDTVKDGLNGYLVPIKDSTILAKKMIELIESPSLIERMGYESRALAVKKYDIKIVNENMLLIMGLSGRGS